MTWSISRMARYVLQTKYYQRLKEKDEYCLEALAKGSYLMFSKDRPLLTAGASPLQTKPVWLSFKDSEHLCENLKASSVLVGVDEGKDDAALFACRVKPELSEKIGQDFEGRFSDMRMAIFTLPTEQYQIVARAYSLLKWNEEMVFCPKCAAPLHRNAAGTMKTCSKACDPKKLHWYPPLYPVAITRVLSNCGEKVLLVRQPRHPKGMFSCIAGFIESGETLEDAVRREIAEEVGIVVENVQYFESQNWPLPQDSLMLGCTAVAMPGPQKLDLDLNELDGAEWFTKDDIRAAFQRIKENPGLLRNNEEGHLLIPPRGAIAHLLLKNWIGSYTPARL